MQNPVGVQHLALLKTIYSVPTKTPFSPFDCHNQYQPPPPPASFLSSIPQQPLHHTRYSSLNPSLPLFIHHLTLKSFQPSFHLFYLCLPPFLPYQSLLSVLSFIPPSAICYFILSLLNFIYFIFIPTSSALTTHQSASLSSHFHSQTSKKL